ncbi:MULTISPECIES: hypothetical protein [Sporomusa]|uniref:hypothetical protein n=1 Tax=Sporomusa TaxID=2375 RepID=UPI001662E271|nr:MULTISPECIES: hypothetical protein [Sporomusa]MCM0758477.1 hypothetical protein [Sporomusa sphaeroides DSM 2875]HML34259.1 hypothetical protein [Sporomusa sphaeroides]
MFKNLVFYLTLAIVSPLFFAFLLLLIFTSPIWFFITLPYHISRRTQPEPTIALE